VHRAINSKQEQVVHFRSTQAGEYVLAHTVNTPLLVTPDAMRFKVILTVCTTHTVVAFAQQAR
jgi:hypothetical protein